MAFLFATGKDAVWVACSIKRFTSVSNI